jgi:hypothetical protein
VLEGHASDEQVEGLVYLARAMRMPWNARFLVYVWCLAAACLFGRLTQIEMLKMKEGDYAVVLTDLALMGCVFAMFIATISIMFIRPRIPV